MGKGHDQLSTYGIGADQPAAFWQNLGQQLLQQEFLVLSEDGYSTVSLTDKARQALRERASFHMKPPQVQSEPERPSRSRAGEIDCDEGLFEELRILRKELADVREVPPYVVFGDVALRHMCRSYPQTDGDFLNVPGVGHRKLQEYGQRFMGTITDWLAGNPQKEFPPLPDEHRSRRKRKREKDPAGLSGTQLETLRMFENGSTPAEIAQVRELQENTIEGHLANCVEAGRIDGLDGLVEAEDTTRIRQTIQEVGLEDGLFPIFAALEEKIGYGKIRLVLAQMAREEAL